MDAQPGPLDAPSAPTVGSLWSDVSGLELADELLEWPADVFALAGTILRRTHAYRFAVSPPAGRHWPPRSHWNDVVSDAAEHWCGWVGEPGGDPPPPADTAHRRLGTAAQGGRHAGRRRPQRRPLAAGRGTPDAAVGQRR